MRPTKHAQLLALMAAGDWRAALKLAASFHDLGAHKDAITRGWEACARPELYRQMGKDPEQLMSVGVVALRERYL